jgi:hypothetical protein
MKVQIHDLVAACPRCGGTEFEQVADEPLRLPSELRCTACGTRSRYLALINQIGEEAMRRANRAIDNLKKKRPPH